MNSNKIELKRYNVEYGKKIGKKYSAKQLLNTFVFDSPNFKIIKRFNNLKEAEEAFENYDSRIDIDGLDVYILECCEIDKNGELIEGTSFTIDSVTDCRFDSLFNYTDIKEIEFYDPHFKKDKTTINELLDTVKGIDKYLNNVLIELIYKKSLNSVVDSMTHEDESWDEAIISISREFESNIGEVLKRIKTALMVDEMIDNGGVAL